MFSKNSELLANSELLFNSFDDDQLNAVGVSSGNPGSVLGFGYIIVGHAIHHANIIRERYCKKSRS